MRVDLIRCKEYFVNEKEAEEFAKKNNGKIYSVDFLGGYEVYYVNEDKSLTKAKNLIVEYWQKEFEKPNAEEYSLSAITDISNIGLAYTTTEDEKHEIQASVDLEHFCLIRYIDDVEIEKRQYNSLDELIDKELYGLDFMDLVYVSDEDIEKVENTQALNEKNNDIDITE